MPWLWNIGIGRCTMPCRTRDCRAAAQAKPKKEKLGIKAGEPLPASGTCKHYKKSYRWYRCVCMALWHIIICCVAPPAVVFCYWPWPYRHLRMALRAIECECADMNAVRMQVPVLRADLPVRHVPRRDGGRRA
jgi:hypothetical protein